VSGLEASIGGITKTGSPAHVTIVVLSVLADCGGRDSKVAICEKQPGRPLHRMTAPPPRLAIRESRRDRRRCAESLEGLEVMIDTTSGDRFAVALRHLVSAQITNDKFEDTLALECRGAS
jgi:hypothetical protein